MEMKKQRELHLAGLLIERLAELAGSTLSPEERPDVVISVGPRRIGLEVTELYLNTEARRTEGEVAEILAAAERQACSRGVPPLQVAVSVVQGTNPSKRQRQMHVAELLETISVELPSIMSQGRAQAELEIARRSSLFRTIDVWRLRERATPCWTTVRVGFAATDFREAVESRIAAKEARYPGYTRRDATWLLIVLPGENVSSFVDLDYLDLDAPYASSFSRVFLMEEFSRAVRELPIEIVSDQN